MCALFISSTSLSLFVHILSSLSFLSFFFNDPATTETYTYWHHSFPTRRSSDLIARDTRPGTVADLFEGYVAALKDAGKPSWKEVEKGLDRVADRSEEHTSELQSLMRISYAVFCLKKKKQTQEHRSIPICEEITQEKTHTNTNKKHKRYKT